MIVGESFQSKYRPIQRFTSFPDDYVYFEDLMLHVFSLINDDELQREIAINSLYFRYWQDGASDFLRAPVFGVGFDDGVVIEGVSYTFSNPFSGMYHSIIFQFLAAAGAVGFLAFLYHCVEYARLLFKRISADKLFILLLPAMIIVMSLVDNFFFYFNFQIFYAAFFALAEKESRKK